MNKVIVLLIGLFLGFTGVRILTHTIYLGTILLLGLKLKGII